MSAGAKWAAVTGGTSGIGHEIVIALARIGWDVAVSCLELDARAEQMAGETIREAMVNLSAAHVDSHPLTVEVAISGHQVGDLDLRRALRRRAVL